jgi:hypothetical protein
VNIDTERFGAVYPCPHALDRMERHGVDRDYVGGLIDECETWSKQGDGRVRGEVETDGVLWRLIVQEEKGSRTEHDHDLVTVVPRDVDVDEAEDRFGPTQALNLALYANGG